MKEDLTAERFDRCQGRNGEKWNQREEREAQTAGGGCHSVRRVHEEKI